MVQELHVAMLPWSAFGHLMPFLQLSIALARNGIRVSFLSTPRIIQRLPKPPPCLSTLISMVELPFQTLNDSELLPDGAEATMDIPMEKIQYLKIAYDQLQEPFKEFIASQRPDWVFIDAIPDWAPAIAHQFGVRVLSFSAFSAAACVFFSKPRNSPEELSSPPDWVDFPSTVAYRSYDAPGVFHGFYRGNASGSSDSDRVTKSLRESDVLAIRSCTEFEGEYLQLLEKLHGKPVIPVGLLPPETQIGNGSPDQIFSWLDRQNPKSVVFVGFGSECKQSRDQIFEIADGLELSGLPFLWALRKPNWAATDADALPTGFTDRVSNRGLVTMGWVPQIEILAHPSIGGSLFHAGWGSVIETLQFGHCLIVLPLIIDQPLNARALVDKGLAVEVERRDHDGSFTADGVALALRLAMVAKEGEGFRRRAREAAAVFGDRKLHEEHYIGRFVEYLKKQETS